MTQKRRLAALVPILGAAVLASTLAHASPREATIGHMRAIRSGAVEEGLESWINGGHHQAVAEGESVEFHFRPAERGHLLAVYLDSEGGVLVARPAYTAGEAPVAAGREVVFPSTADLELRASPPHGHETLFAILTPERVSLQGLLPEELHDVVVLSPEQGAAFVEGLRKRLQQMDGVRIGTFEHRVVADAESHPWLDRDVITRRLGDRTRALRPPRVELDVRFEFDSDILTEAARAQLDEAGAALQRLPEREFRLSGHTDSVGTEAYNLDLSKRRARAAVDYLVERWDIDRSRLEPRGFGESRPFRGAPGKGNDALDRRVEIESSR